MKALAICNDPPYGTERSWNGLLVTEHEPGHGEHRRPPFGGTI